MIIGTVMRHYFLIFYLCLFSQTLVFAQSTEQIPAVCDLSDAPRQNRFYQRQPTLPNTGDDSDFWQFSSLSAEGINPNIMLEGLAQLTNSRTRRSFILIRRGKIVFEQYFNGSDVKDSNNVASVSKSILSALFGIAMDQGYIETAEQPISDFLPDYFADITDPRKQVWTIRDFLTMTQGYAWAENITDRGLNSSDNIVGDILNLPLVDEPGEFFNYSTGASHVLSAVLTEATGMSTCEFAHKYLLEPMGIEAEFWGYDPQGYFTGGHSLSLTPREIAKFGMLFLNEGNWYGQQLVPGWWVVASTTPRIEVGNFYRGYGYFWWLNRLQGYEMFSALGYGGQLLHVIPRLDIVLVETHSIQGNPRDFAEEADSYRFISNYLFPAIVN